MSHRQLTVSGSEDNHDSSGEESGDEEWQADVENDVLVGI